MLFMVIEHFDQARVKDVYRRFRERGRMAPEGLTYVDSWIAADLSRCFQVMQCDDVALLQEWVLSWSDLARFEIVPIAASKDTAAAVGKHL
ncbi:MAG TPA: DUF3303 family protein [Bosea sp. (in: a-proteobacteria)]|jgi:hypothetical protein|uniref:DUF3303 domain-containing protein n=1 Tax=Bosea sp. (in: a-proteobacteria) TaxID=1871050 RepID=UPI002E11F951|nr:DUF3303 family protein [Bosea sp. (in: a-proteobacteria)]